jgi:hypothetical protein
MLHKRWFALTALMVVVLAAFGGYVALAQSGNTANAEVMQFEVAEDGNRFAFDKSRVYEDGMPAHGSGFVTQGYIYPVGTLNGSNGVLADGTPEFPDKVIGEWACYGYMIGEAGHATTGEWVISTQVYKFTEEYNNQIIVTNGYELADFNVPVSRAITGGTGTFNTVSGEQTQTLLGFTEQMGVNLTVEMHLKAK